MLLPCQALTLSAQISNPDGGETLLEIHQIQWFWGSRVPNFDRHPNFCLAEWSFLLIQYVVLIRIVFRAMGWQGSFLPPAPLSGINPACCAFPTSTKTLILANMFFHCIVHWNTELLTCYVGSMEEPSNHGTNKKHQYHLPSLTTNKQKMATLQGTTVAPTFIFKSRKGLPSTSQGKWHSWMVHTQPLQPCDLAINYIGT